MTTSRSEKTRMAAKLTRLTFAVAVSAALFAASSAVAAETLPKLGAALPQTSVSGLSSGAFMAGQFEVAHAENVVGAGIVAGGPFACAETATARLFPYWLTGVAQNAIQAAQQCMQTTLGEPDAAKLFARAKELAEKGEIDPLPALAKHNVYLYSGDEDSTVGRPVVEAAKRFYELAGVPEANLTYVKGSGGHAFITEEGGAACGLSEPPFVSDCDYDQARAILGWIYGPLKPASAEAQGDFIVFEQGEFAGPGGGLAGEGVVYVPPSCRTEPGCRVHVALHGCQQSRAVVGETFVERTGYAELADTNRLVILFPQIASSAVNPQGCWDWWGYTGLDYLGKDAPQISALWKMVERLAEAPPQAPANQE
ncbi:PHB depolymerase family esterase [Methyloceanibacter sp.]|uniref:extracellular catalytic domain type 2 short-chain-length polyhydroxyalkanoate depolymerase n=1 Tax=Methyloceanibacter sp. TaxID=1965321 RepID=UPI00208C5A17|nr:PHB depolymerase family esterase [Methyloceanibacter sp.]GFO80671.1 MAG: depolymerase [Methyloceanibacter sp.]HML91368.1 PHB depolymerase family esterase [Methyloceanibacter sp.]